MAAKKRHAHAKKSRRKSRKHSVKKSAGSCVAAKRALRAIEKKHSAEGKSLKSLAKILAKK